MNFKKLFVLALSLLMVIGMMTGCTKKPEEKAQSIG